MLLTPSQMLTQLRDWLNEPNAGLWTNPILMGKLNSASGRMVRDISEQDNAFFIATTAIDFVADQALYDLPRNASLGAKWDHAADLDVNGKPEKFVYDYRLRDHVIGDFVSNPATTTDFRISFQGAQLRVTPIPAVSESSAIRIFYKPVYGDIHEGTVSSATTTSLVFPSSFSATSTTDYSQFSYPSLYDDFYNGMDVHIIAGTGAGQVRNITDYVGTTRTATVADWSTTPTTGSTYAVVSPVPEMFHEVVPLDAALEAAPKSARRRLGEISALRQIRYQEMMDFTHQRQSFRDDAVIPDFTVSIY